MAYRVVKKIRGRRYVYEQTSVRVGRRVKTISTYIGPLDEVLGAPAPKPSPLDRLNTAIKRFFPDEKYDGPLTDEELIWRGIMKNPTPEPDPEPAKPIMIDGDRAFLTNPAGSAAPKDEPTEAGNDDSKDTGEKS